MLHNDFNDDITSTT